MTTSREFGSSRLERDFDIVLLQNQRLMQENELLRGELRRHPAGVLQIRSVERSLTSSQQSCTAEDKDLFACKW